MRRTITRLEGHAGWRKEPTTQTACRGYRLIQEGPARSCRGWQPGRHATFLCVMGFSDPRSARGALGRYQSPKRSVINPVNVLSPSSSGFWFHRPISALRKVGACPALYLPSAVMKIDGSPLESVASCWLQNRRFSSAVVRRRRRGVCAEGGQGIRIALPAAPPRHTMSEVGHFVIASAFLPGSHANVFQMPAELFG